MVLGYQYVFSLAYNKKLPIGEKNTPDRVAANYNDMVSLMRTKLSRYEDKILRYEVQNGRLESEINRLTVENEKQEKTIAKVYYSSYTITTTS